MRKGQDMKQQELADKAGVSVRTIRNLEAGRNELSPGNLSAVLDALGYRRPAKPWDEETEGVVQMWAFRLSRFSEVERAKRIDAVSRYLIKPMGKAPNEVEDAEN